VERILRASATDEDGCAFAFQRHAELVRAIGTPEYAVGTGYMSFRYSEYPAGLSADVMLAAPDAPIPVTNEEIQHQRNR
jgi:hypothetical protein